jgi:site-specific DNA-methyltransferase (adenine-specific)
MKVLHGDCLDLMKDIETGSIDMILCDLPYGTTQCKWDTVIPFEPLWAQYKRIIKDNGAIVLTAAQPFTSALVMSNVKMFRYDWVWEKPKGTGHLNAKKQPMRNKEDVLVFYKKQCTYRPQFITGEPYKNKAGKDHNKISSMTDSYGAYTNHREVNTGFRYPKQIQKFNVVERGTVHPTQKPVALFEYLIKTYTNEGDLVLDNCAGSGTTGVACIRTGRDFILMEKEQKYVDIIKGRLEGLKK